MVHPTLKKPHSLTKPLFMPANYKFIRIISIAFMVAIGYALAKAFYYGSFMGIMLAMVSLCAAIYFFYTLMSIKRETERDNAY
jgi:cellobiose-specific phosphotransferase system component IIC